MRPRVTPNVTAPSETAKTSAELWAVRQVIADLYLEGKTQHEIGAEVKLAQGTVSKHLKAVVEEWMRTAAAAIDERKAHELARLDHLERVAWRAWERSCEDAVTVQRETTGRGRKGMTTEKRTGQCGDPRFLAEVRHCVELRGKILGLVVKKLEHSGRVSSLVIVGADPTEAI